MSGAYCAFGLSGACMIQGVTFPLPMKKGFGATDRVDKWWKGPTAMAAYLGFMILYATWRGFMEADFWIFSDFGLSAGVGHGAGTMAIEDTGSHVLSPLYSQNGQYFLDPSDKKSREYVLNIALEACLLGFDEIQLDYIRYPDLTLSPTLTNGF